MSEALRKWVADKTNMTVIWLNPNAPRPSTRPYASINILNSSRVHRESVGEPNENGVSTIAGDRDVTVSISIYGDTKGDPRSAMNEAEALRDSLELPSVRETLRAGGWVFRDVEMITDVARLVGSQWEPRATLDVRFGTTVSQTDDVGIIERTEITGTAKNPGAEDQQINISVEAE